MLAYKLSIVLFRIVFWDVLPCKILVDNYFTRQYIPEDNSEHHTRCHENLKSHIVLCCLPVGISLLQSVHHNDDYLTVVQNVISMKHLMLLSVCWIAY
jgi:hypothetical protein